MTIRHPALLLSRTKGATPVSARTLTENWAGGSLDTSRWVFDKDFNGSPGTPSSADYDITSGVLHLKATDVAAFNSDGRIMSVKTFSLLNGGGSRIYAKIDLPGPNNSAIEFSFTVGNGDCPDQGMQNSYAAWSLSGGTFYRLLSNQGTLSLAATDVTYDPVAHAYWSFGSDGTNALWETAPDAGGVPGTWTTRSTLAILGNVQNWSLNKVRCLFRRSNTAALTATTDAIVGISNVNVSARVDPLFSLANLF